MRPNWLYWSKILGSSQTWGVLGSLVGTVLWPKKPEEKGLPRCLIIGCSCISESSSLRRKQACSYLKGSGGNYDKKMYTSRALRGRELSI